MKNLESMLAENMRRFNTKNLSEQTAPTPTTPVAAKPAATPSPIPGFIFAEDDKAWLGPTAEKTTNEINEENYNRIFKYYGLAVGGVINPDALIGKLAFSFKPITDPKKQMQYSKEFVDPRMFNINSISFNPTTKAVSIFSDKMGASTYMQVMPYSTKDAKIIVSNGFGTPNTYAFNPVFATMYQKVSTDPKYIKAKPGATPTK
jgi:hypothetical protein